MPEKVDGNLHVEVTEQRWMKRGVDGAKDERNKQRQTDIKERKGEKGLVWLQNVQL